MTRTYLPLRLHRYHTLSDESLRYIVKDAGEAMRYMKGFDAVAEAKYADQVTDACTILHWRATSFRWPQTKVNK